MNSPCRDIHFRNSLELRFINSSVGVRFTRGNGAQRSLRRLEAAAQRGIRQRASEGGRPAGYATREASPYPHR